jgi:hypothetical protein
MNKPKRKVELEIKLGADSWAEAANALQSIVDRIKNKGPIIKLISGGYESGYSVVAAENSEQTGDKYRSDNEEYCNQLRQKSQEITI